MNLTSLKSKRFKILLAKPYGGVGSAASRSRFLPVNSVPTEAPLAHIKASSD
jgi:hypothetical protein